MDYLIEDRLEHQRGDSVEPHRIEISEQNPDRCTPNNRCSEHERHLHDREPAEHKHHPMIPHGDHMDYVHEGRLHHHHGDHCDDHGPVAIVQS